MKFGGRKRRTVNPDLTPMIDVTFQLILFFMVTTEFIQSHQRPAESIQVDLPRAEASAVSQAEDDLSIWVSRDGGLFLGSSLVDLDRLRAHLREVAQQDTTRLVVIQADAGVAHGRVVEVMDLARAAGLTRLAIATEPNESP